MRALLARAAGRFYARHPWQLALAVTGICLGVAVYVGVDLANDSARRAFDVSAQALRGPTTHRLLPVGGRIADAVYAELVLARRASAAAPVVEAVIAAGAAGGPRYALRGVDPIAELTFGGFSRFTPGPNADLEALIAVPATVLLPEPVAADLDAARGTSIRIAAAGRTHDVRVVGAVAALDAGAAPPIIADVSTAQELLGRVGELDRIDLVLTGAEAAALAAALPAGTTLVPAGGESGALTEMTRAFRTNLTALGLLALVVGMFLVYATISFAVVQRRHTIGLLRSLGTRRRTLLASFLVEALGIGIVGTAAGLALGHVLARGLVDLVLQTVGDLTFTATMTAADPSPWVYVRGAALGLGATALAAFVPALEAARTQPAAALERATLERAARARGRRAAWLAAPLLLTAGLLLLAGESLLVAFAALFLVLSAGALAVPAATEGLTRLAAPVARRAAGLPGLLAVRGVGASLSRTGVAAAALSVAVATVIGVSLMIGSFRESLVAWLDTTLTADVYLSADASAADASAADAGAANAGASRGFTPERLAALAALPEIRGLSLSRIVRLPTRFGELTLRAATPGPDGYGLDLVAGDAARLETRSGTSSGTAREAGAAPGVLVAEPIAFRLGIDVGDVMELPTPAGSTEFEVAGIFRDYSTSDSALVLALPTYRRHWNDERVTGVGVHFRRDVETGAGAAKVRAALDGAGGIRMRSTESIERLSLAVFDRTFEITEVLRLLAGLVAFLGILSAALAIQLERARELAILRAIGFSRRELGVLILTQTGLLGLAAGIAAVPIGTVLAALLVHVINRRSFGWTMELVIAPAPILLGVGLAVAAALLAGIYPAVRGSRTSLDAALRDE